MKLFISVISHGHGGIISRLDALGPLSCNFIVIIKNNKPDIDLLEYCARYPEIILLDQEYGMGFGQNNNYVFRHCKNNHRMVPNDYFLVLNPDVYFTQNDCSEYLSFIKESNIEFSTINLYRDYDKKFYDKSVRFFPTFTMMIGKIFGIKGLGLVDKEVIDFPTIVDWAAGSFLCFNTSLYGQLNGFDEGFFMYYEDVDICHRAKKNGYDLVYIPSISGIHIGAFSNRKLFSKHQIWYLKSAIRYLVFTRLHTH